MTFARLLSEAVVGDLPRSGDVLAVGLPLLRQIEALHQRGLVTGTAGVSALDYDGDRLRVRSSQPVGEASNPAAVDAVTMAAHGAGIRVNARREADLTDPSSPGRLISRDVVDPDHGPPERPVFVSGYRVWEQLHGHHDELTDIALAGLWLASYAYGLDLETPGGIDTLALHHRTPSRLNGDLHPVLGGVLAEMVDPDRSRRPPDLGQVIARFEHHRELPADLDLSAAYLPDTDWRRTVLATLRDRVFDTSRRNRELYYRPTASSIPLTEASVPLMLDIERIKAGDLLTWTGPVSAALGGGEVDLARWCRFEEAPYLAPALDKLIADERRTTLETGHGRLRLIIAFLRWYDPAAAEAVVSPLLTLPAALVRRKGVETRYRLDASGHDATVNPVLRHVFANRFDIDLPETVATDDGAIAAFVADLERSVRSSSPAVSIELVDKPRVDLLRRRAQLRVDTYRRRRARSLATSGRWRRQDFSYDPEDWRPLGHALYDRFVRTAELPLRDLAGAAPRPRTSAFNHDPIDDTAADPAGGPGARTSETFAIVSGEASADRWQVDLCSVTLALLGSRRTSLARDYDEVLTGDSLDITTTPFEALFRPDRPGARPDGVEPLDPSQMLVLPADDAQARAVRRAVRGDSFIIQGPPGTGKSQTIANVIAALVAESKRVLFVCEKRAAIDVVAHRLDQVGLGDLTALIHDSQLDRKRFVTDLGATYHAWLTDLGPDGPEGPGARPAEDHRTGLLNEIQASLRPLRDLTRELGHDLADGLPVAAAIERLARLETGAGVGAGMGVTAGKAAGSEATIPDWYALRPQLDRVAEALGAAGLAHPLGELAGLRLAPGALVDVDPVSACRRQGRDLLDAVAGLDPSLLLRDLGDAGTWGPVVESAAAVGALAALVPDTAQHGELREAARRQSELARTVDATAAVLERWTTPPSPEDTLAALEVAEAREGSILKFLNGRWRAVKALVEASYRFDSHQVRPTVTAVLTDLAAHHRAIAALAELEASTRASFGTPDAGAVCGLVEAAHDRPPFAALVAGGGDVGSRAGAFATVARLGADLLVGPDTTIGDLARLGDGLAGTPVAAEPALVAWSQVEATGTGALVAVLDAGRSLDEFEAGVLRRELQRWQASVGGERFGGSRVDDAVASLGRLYRDLLDANAAVVVERARATFLGHVAQSDASMAGGSTEDQDRAQAYRAGRRVVEREAEKKMRHRTIREMASGESAVVVRDLRPVWLMSPLSVSDTLPLEADLFDAVIFDEASQIPVEDAIPSVLRAPQVVVVGDRMQMPPSRFFSAEDDEDGDVVVDRDGHRLSLTLDADSFLTQSELALSSSMLNWHYRSRSESLIAYSNAAFYGGRLATVPDTILHPGEQSELAPEDADDAVTYTPETLARPISFHYLAHGRYHDRRNLPEADYIAEMVRAVLRTDDPPTIGVVAFSEAQQGAIESALDELAVIDPGFAERYEAERQRTEDDEFVGLFVKNLENVQGDERDLIIMSVCYGPDPDGRIRMTFGPINNAGGERRLNVIFSRARRHMAVVSSMRGSAITNRHNDGAAHLAGFLTYAEAESRGHLTESAAQLRSLAIGAEPGRVVRAEPGRVVGALAAGLRERGWTADVGVGRSAFRVDLAIAVNGAYRLGVLIEPGPDTGSAPGDVLVPARYVAEAGVLRAFGWPIIRVPLSDWFTDPGRVIDRVEAAARAAG
ncbi:MAG: AAA domain-containing protein [Acidimicrobiales bacterium]